MGAQPIGAWNGIHEVRQRDPLIGGIFRELDLIETWGSGVPGMFREAEALGLPAPEIVELGMRVRVIVHLNEPVLPNGIQSRKAPRRRPGSDAPASGAQSRARSGAQSGLESRRALGLESGLESRTALRILRALADGALSRSEIARVLGHIRVSGAVNRVVKELLEGAMIAYVLPDKPTSRLQKYRLTERGRAAISPHGGEECTDR